MVSYIRSDLDFILAQIKIAEDHALYEQSGGAQGRSLFGPDGSIPTYNLSWGLRTVDGTYNNPLHPEWGAADNPFPEHLGTDFRTVMIDHDGNPATPPLPVSYTPGVDNDGPGTAGASDVFDPTVRTISNLLVDQTLGNPSAILTALQRAGIVAPAQQLAVTALISAAYEPLKPLFNALSAAERADAAAQAAASASPGNAALQQAAAATAAAVVTAQANLDAQSGPLMALLEANGVELDGANVVITNTAPDEGLSAPFNSWFTLFGQFFDHGLDLVAKGGNGTVFIPLMPDDPLYVPGGQTNFMVLTRATLAGPGADGVLGTGDDTTRPVNTTTSFVDQNQTYTSHPSHQVFLRQYVLDETTGQPVATGRLIEGSNGGMATWADLKAQARDILGIDLTDEYVGNLPLLATDPYGNFIPDPITGFPQVVMAGSPPVLASGTPDAPLNLVEFVADGPDEDTLEDVVHLAVQTGHAFLADIAHNAVPEGVRDGDIEIGLDNGDGSATDGFYDNELLDAHFIAGDGRANENIGLTAVHHVFHSEHNRLVEHTKEVVLADAQALLDGGALQEETVAFLNEWLAVDVTEVPASTEGLVWDGERLFQAAKFGTEMQYQHLVFEEFARKIQPNINVFLVPDGFDVTIDPSIVAEFAHVVYRFGHSMLTESIDRFDPTFTEDHIGLIEGFLNPLQFQNNGGTETVDANIAAGAIIRGMTRQAGNEIDEFVTSALRNNLLGLPLDLATINLARGRDTGVPSLNAARAQFYAATNQDVLLKPYESWVDFAGHLKHEASIINFIAAYGTHSTITSAQTIEGKRDAAFALVFGGDGAPTDRVDFLNATGDYAGGTLGGLNNVDLWIGGLAEEIMPFGGMLGSTFNFVFEMQMEKLQNGDRFYYLQRLDGLHLFGEMENNSFAAMIMRNTDATHLPSDVFSNPGLILEVDQTMQYNSDTGVFLPGVAPGETWTAPSSVLLPAVAPPGQTWTGPGTAALALLAAREDGSPLVDDVFYNKVNPDVAAAGVDPDAHYAQFGRQEGRLPNQFFDAAYYAAQNPDVTGNFMDHYATFGWKEGRNPSAQFDGSRYLAENPDVAAEGMNPLLHFLQYGRYEGRQYYPIGNPAGQTWTTAYLEDGIPLVDDVFYNMLNPDVAAAGVDPDVHYAQFGRQEGRQPNQFFDAAFYGAQNPGFTGNLVEHYLTSGWAQGKNPSAQFDGARYLAENPDVAAAGMNPLAHFLQYGRYEGRQYYPIGNTVQTLTALSMAALAALEDGSPLVDDVFYNNLYPDIPATGVDPDAHYAQFGRQEGRQPNQFFDAAFYAAQNPGFTGNLVEHYLTSGWAQGKNPSAQFDGARYLAENPDVAAAGMNPLAHFLQYGRYEGRQYYPVAADVVDTNADPVGSDILTELVIRDNNYLEYTGGDHVVLGGTNNADILIAGIGDDTLYGDGGNDRLEGGFGNDIINAGDGDDIIVDSGGDDNIKAGAGHDVVHAGPGLDLVMGNDGQDFIFLGTDMGSEVFAGTGNDFIYGNKNAERILGNEGDDWIETGTFDGAPGDNFDEIFSHDGIDGNDVFLGDGGFDEFIGEGGDDIMVGSAGRGKMVGMSGFDWATYKDNLVGVNADLSIPIIFDEAPTLPQNAALDEFESMEGLSGTRFSDVLKGSNTLAEERLPALQGGSEGYLGSALDAQGIALINGLQDVLGAGVNSFIAGDIILGGDGSDLIQGNAGNDIIDGDKWLDVQIRVNGFVPNGIPALHDSMTTLAESMFSGAINPSQLEIVRTIRDDSDSVADVDTAVFSGELAEYDVDLNADGTTTVAHDGGQGIDGTDTLSNIEQLQFSDGTVGLIVGTGVLNGTVNDGFINGLGANDTLDMSTITANITVDLGTGFEGRGSASSSQSGTDVLRGIENVVTGAGADTITASNSVNTMDGGDGIDTFRFLSSADANGDTILGFEPGDRIDLFAIDSGSSNDTFTLVTGAGFNAAGELKVGHEIRDGEDYTIVEGNTDADTTDAEFKISIKGNHTLTEGDFNL